MWVHDPITFSHKQGMVTIFHKGREVVLKGAEGNSNDNLIAEKRPKHLLTKASHGFRTYLLALKAGVKAQVRTLRPP